MYEDISTYSYIPTYIQSTAVTNTIIITTIIITNVYTYVHPYVKCTKALRNENNDSHNVEILLLLLLLPLVGWLSLLYCTQL